MLVQVGDAGKNYPEAKARGQKRTTERSNGTGMKHPRSHLHSPHEARHPMFVPVIALPEQGMSPAVSFRTSRKPAEPNFRPGPEPVILNIASPSTDAGPIQS